MASPRAPVLEDATRAALENKEINILVICCYHVGKSTLINILFFDGEEKAPEGRSMRPCTSEVDCYPTLVDGILFNFFDSPGLQDGRQGDRDYISTMAEKCSTPSLLIYCTKLGDPIKPHEKEALGNLASAFGENVWKKFVIALTFANEVRPPRRKDRTVYFHDIMTRKKKALRVCFKELGFLTSKLPAVYSLLDLRMKWTFRQCKTGKKSSRRTVLLAVLQKTEVLWLRFGGNGNPM